MKQDYFDELERLEPICIDSDDEVEYPKQLLKPKDTYEVGDFVTINDKNEVIEVYIVEEVQDNEIILCGIALSLEKDDVIPYSFSVKKSNILPVSDSSVNMNGALWNIRNLILHDKAM